MKTYLVGGAVRDELLGREVHDKDYVVVGSSIDEMLAKGFTKVGADFPVFLHPKTNEEYALARKEKKVAPGYTGFEYVWEGVTLEEDLLRRDLTINAMAKDLDTEEIIDPYGGQKDIQDKVLRHVSEHFVEDPLRVLRLARFLTQFENFKVADSTKNLCMEIAKTDELLHLTGERIWKEMQKTLSTNDPRGFFEFLKETNSLDRFMPELSCLEGIPQNPKYHPEGCVWTHTMLVLKSACDLTNNLDVRFAALVHDLGKGVTPKDELPSHKMHDINGVPLVEKVCDRFHVSSKTKRLALKVTKLHLKIHRSKEMKMGTLIKLLKEIDALRNPEFFENVLLACKADDFGKLRDTYEPENYLLEIAKGLREMKIKPLIEGKDPKSVPDVILMEQIKVAKGISSKIK